MELPPVSNKPKLILIGKARAGKSTLANMLAFGTLKGNNHDKFLYSDAPRGVTTECCAGEGELYRVVDTIGLCEGTNATVSHDDAKDEVFDRIRKENLGIRDFIIFVTRNPRPDQMEIGLWREFQETFPQYLKQTLIVQTRNFNGLTNDEKAGFLRALKADQSTPVISVSFPPPNGKEINLVDERDRQVSLGRITEALKAISWNIHTRQKAGYDTNNFGNNKHTYIPIPENARVASQDISKDNNFKPGYNRMTKNKLTKFLPYLIALLAIIGMIIAIVIAINRGKSHPIVYDSIEFLNGLNITGLNVTESNITQPFTVKIIN